MIPRYTRPEMAAIWEPQTRFKIWFEIEAHAADALAELGTIPKEAAKTIWAKARDVTFDVARIDEIERGTKHDVIAFLTHPASVRQSTRHHTDLRAGPDPHDASRSKSSILCRRHASIATCKPPGSVSS